MIKLVSKAYELVTNLRNHLFESGKLSVYHSKIPVISVGNLTMGGNGKTPLSMYIAEVLLNQNLRVLILTRGYKSQVAAPYLVVADDLASKVGDEALLMSRNTGALVLIDPKRVRGIKFVEDSNLADVVILDDAYQHRYIGRNINILAIDVSSKKVRQDFLQGHVFPSGRFRENLRKGMSRADAVVLVNRSLSLLNHEVDQFIGQLEFDKKLFIANLASLGVSNVLTGKVVTSQKVVAFCGLANPEAFYKSLEFLGFELLDKISFPDHYNFRSNDLQNLRSKYPLIPMVCTDKDLVKFRELADPGLHVLSTKLQFVQAQDFNNFIIKSLSLKEGNLCSS